ncbi:unnamed protein product [Macrosiphum euphorbiae]|uniref:LAGLIDADG homing endonuclease n=1 Tax=Macrosiphum euphorbiae TaxID=13131 RepID=A0AAV0X106_9HEMI|nr:unnamed protein product [Macrosiphum euphorbiae]
MADLAECFIATGSNFHRNDFLLCYYITREEISTNKMHLNIKKLSTRIKKKLVPAAYLARFTDNYYINRVKHPTF